MSIFPVETSDALHARVQTFIRSSLDGSLAEPFDLLACDIARYQASRNAGIDRLALARGVDLARLDQADAIPAIPTEVFKLRRVACHDPTMDEFVFRTSGTTVGSRGQHPFRSTSTYRAAARAWAHTMLLPDIKRARVAILAPDFATTSDSSLSFMLRDLASFLNAEPCWLVHDGVLVVDALYQLVDLAVRDGLPVLLAGASFAFVHLLDVLRGHCLELPEGSRIMQTGGFKGRVKEVEPAQLRADIARTLGVETTRIVGEYGMTELGSQAYEGVLRAALGLPGFTGPFGVYFPPAWMRVSAVDPVSLAPLPKGQVGIARIVDLANVDSAVAVQTADRIRVLDHGFELLGRLPGATPRGCSIGIDEVLGESSR